MMNWFMIIPLIATSVTKNSVKIECAISVICLVSLQVFNLKYKVTMFFPVVFHNVSGYDSHLFIKTLGNGEGVYQIMKKTTFLSRNRSSLTNLLIMN